MLLEQCGLIFAEAFENGFVDGFAADGGLGLALEALLIAFEGLPFPVVEVYYKAVTAHKSLLFLALEIRGKSMGVGPFHSL